jgi:hypothetical protein
MGYGDSTLDEESATVSQEKRSEILLFLGFVGKEICHQI